MLAPLLVTVSFLGSVDISLDPLQDFVQVGYELFERSSFSLLVGHLYINVFIPDYCCYEYTQIVSSIIGVKDILFFSCNCVCVCIHTYIIYITYVYTLYIMYTHI